MNTCKHGHPWTPANSYTDTRGALVCRECKRLSGKRRRNQERLRIMQALGSVREWLRLRC